MKLTIVTVLQNYDIKMGKKPYWRSVCWRTGVVPRSSIITMFRKKQPEKV